MARYNTSLASATITGTTTIGTPNSGAFTALTGSAPYTVTLPAPNAFPGSNQTFYNSTGGTITLSTPGGAFNGTGGSGTSSVSIFSSNVVSVTSDGTNYIVISEDGSAMAATTGSFSSNVTVGGTLTVQSSGGVSMAPSSAGNIDNVAIGVNARSSGAFTTLAANGQVSLTANTASSSTSTGTLVVTGGVGVTGTINAASVVASLTGTIQTAAQPNITSTGALTIPGLTVDTTTLVVDSTNDRVGVGIASPTSTLDIYGQQANTGATSASVPTGTLRLAHVGGSGGGEFGSSIVFSQQWFSGSPTAQVAVGQIAGVKIGVNGSFGGGLAFFTSNLTSNDLAERLRINNAGNIGIGTNTPAAKLHVFNRADGGTAPYTPEIRIEHQDINAIGTQGADGGVLSFYNIQRDNTGWSEGKRWGQIDFYPSQPTAGVAQIGARIFAAADGNGSGAIGSTNTASYLSFSTTSGTTLNQRLKIDSQGRFLFNTTDFSYTQHDNTPLVGGKTNNAVFVNGSVQLLSNDDAFVVGRGSGSFFKDEEIGFGWGSGWYMTDTTYLRMRNPSGKILYMANAAVHTPKVQNNSGSMLFCNGSKGNAAEAFDMFRIDGLGGSNGFFSIEIFFSHSGGGMHGAWAIYKVSTNAYSDQQAIANTTAQWGGSGEYSFTRDNNDRMTVRWLGQTGFSTSYSMYAIINANRGISVTNIGMDGFDAG